MEGIKYVDQSTGNELHIDKFNDEITVYIKNPDGIVLQVYLPPMDGLSIAEHLRTIAREQESERQRKDASS